MAETLPPTPAQLRRIDEYLASPWLDDAYINTMGTEKVRNLLKTRKGAGVLLQILKRRIESQQKVRGTK